MIDSDQDDNIEDLEIDEGSIESQAEEIEQDEGAESEAQESESTEESESEAEQVKQDKKSYVDIKDPAVKARVDQLTREKHEARREVERMQRELQQYKKEPEPPKEVPPPSADPVTDPDVYAQQVRAREQYIKDQVKFESESQQRKQQSEANEQRKQEQLLTTYNKNMARLKVSPEDLKKAADTVTQYGISKELTEFLLEDDDGPAIVKYLHGNVDVLADLVSMSPVKAAAFIERSIRGKLNAKPISKAPPPPTKVSGSRTSSATVDADGTTYE